MTAQYTEHAYVNNHILKVALNCVKYIMVHLQVPYMQNGELVAKSKSMYNTRWIHERRRDRVCAST